MIISTLYGNICGITAFVVVHPFILYCIVLECSLLFAYIFSHVKYKNRPFQNNEESPLIGEALVPAIKQFKHDLKVAYTLSMSDNTWYFLTSFFSIMLIVYFILHYQMNTAHHIFILIIYSSMLPALFLVEVITSQYSIRKIGKKLRLLSPNSACRQK